MSVVALVIAPSIAMTVSNNNDSDVQTENIQVSEETSVSVVDGKVEAVITEEIKDLIINREVMSIKDIKNPTDFELKHTPEITFGKEDENGLVEVFVKIGSNGIVHPNQEDHWIDIVSIYAGNEVTSERYSNNGNTTFGPYMVHVKKGETIKVAVGCNLHGFWSNDATYE
jgi:superoxide reductase